MRLDKCKYAEFDRYYSEMLCRKYAMPCRICCVTCRALDLADKEQGDNV